MSEELTIEKIARRVRGNGYWSLVDGVSTFDVAAMSDDLRTLLAKLDEMREVLKAAPVHHYHNCYTHRTTRGVPVLGECHPDCWERQRVAALAQHHGTEGEKQ